MSSPAPEQTPTDGEYPMMWENYGQMIALRQRMLQAIMAFYMNKEEVCEKIYKVEKSIALPDLEYTPQTQAGQNALTKYNAIIASYKNVLKRFEGIYDLA